MQVHIFPRTMRILTVLLLLASSGCEVGRSWFSMSSDSPTPWFGFDLMPRRRTTSQVIPHGESDNGVMRQVSVKTISPKHSSRRSSERVWSKELHLPSIPPLFDGQETEDISYKGPTGPFNR